MDVQPLHVFAWIVDSGLRDSMKALAHALLRRVDRHTWRWPKRHGAQGGVTVADLADGAGLSRRHAARCLRVLEDLGLVRTTFRPFEVSEYELHADAWKSMAEQHKAERAEERHRTRTERIARFNERREAARQKARPVDRAAAPPAPAAAPPSAAPPSAAPPAVATPAAPPRWAWKHAQRIDAAPDTVFALVGGAAAAILGAGLRPEAQGGLARPVLRLWEDRGRPQPALLIQELELVCAWARESVHPDAIGLRGAGRIPQPDRSKDAGTLCAPASFQQRLDLARAHGLAQRQAPPPARPQPPPKADPPLPRRGQPPWVPPGQPSFLPGMAPGAEQLDEAWRGALAHLRRNEDQDRGAIDIFLSPLRPVGVEKGVVVAAAPSEDSARWIVRHLSDALAVLAESLGAPVGLVVDAD